MDTIQILVGGAITLTATYLGGRLVLYNNKEVEKTKDNRKLNRVLFYLLELQHELSMLKGITNYLDLMIKAFSQKIMDKLKIETGPSEEEISQYTKLLVPILLKQLSDGNKLDAIAHKIESLVDDVSEINPTLAYKLSNRFNIRQLRGKIEQYCDSATEVEPDFEKFRDMMGGFIEDKFIEELDAMIETLTKDNESQKSEITKSLLTRDDQASLDAIFDELADRFIEEMKSQHQKQVLVSNSN